jgi:1-acyl-sn-glycerol-3-phosphate acyltransferase
MARLVNRAIGIAGVRIEASGLENAKPGTPYIVVSNHQSFLDISLTSDFLEHLHPRYVSKRELAKGVPGVSFNLARGGSALIDRKNPEQAHAAIEALGDRVREAGWTAVIFPEGTRSKTGQIKSFKSAGLRTLVRKAPGVAILPVTTSGGSRLFSRGMKPLIARGTTLRYVVHPPIAAPDPDDDLAFERFVRELQAIIEAELPKAE